MLIELEDELLLSWDEDCELQEELSEAVGEEHDEQLILLLSWLEEKLLEDEEESGR